MRLGDIDGLETEDASTIAATFDAVTANLRENGATEEEIDFLLQRRVELNAMTAPQLVAFIERKLERSASRRSFPTDETLEHAYRRTRVHDLMDERIEGLQEEVEAEAQDEELPDDLRSQVSAILAEEPELAWDAALRRISLRQ